MSDKTPLQGSLDESLDHMQRVIDACTTLQRDAAFINRILVQAVLTAGGRLEIDTAKADEAMNGNHRLEFGNGCVTIHKSEHSLWPDVSKDPR